MEIKALIDGTEAISIQKIRDEEKRVSTKLGNIYQILLKKKSEIQTLKEEVELALIKQDEFEFLEVGLDEDTGMPSPPACVLLTVQRGLTRCGSKWSSDAAPSTHCTRFLCCRTTCHKLSGLYGRFFVTSCFLWPRGQDVA